MAENKKSVLLYCDIIHTVESLEDEEAGKLFKHYLRYINDLNPVAPDKLTQIVFEPIKQNLKRDLIKYMDKKLGFSDAGKESAKSRSLSKTQLYVLRFFNEEESFIKVGITDYSIGRRYSSSGDGGGKLGYKFDIIHQHFPSVGENVLFIEQKIGEMFKDKKYYPKHKFGGYMECFDINSEVEIIEFITMFNDVQRCSTESTVKDTVTVKVTDTVKGKVIVKEKKENTIPVISENKFSAAKNFKPIFENFYFEKTKGKYYWTGKDAGKCESLKTKLVFKIKEKNSAKKEIEDHDICEAFRYLLSIVRDDWILSNLSMAILDSKFNEIIANNGTKKSNIGVRAGQEHPLQHLHDLSIAVLEGIGRKNSEGGNV